MALSISQLLLRLRSADRWLLVALAAAAAVLLYTGMLGMQYVGGSGRAADLRLEAGQLIDVLDSVAGTRTATGSPLADEEARLAERQARFSYESDDAVIHLLSEHARTWRVRLESAIARGSGVITEGSLIYRVQKLDLRLEGQPSRLLDYIDSLSTDIPGLEVDVVRMGGFGQAPWAALQLSLFLDPVSVDPVSNQGSTGGAS